MVAGIAAAFGLLAIGFFTGRLWNGHGVAWGDVATWLAVIAAGVGAWIALRQLRGQQQDIARQAAQLERQQADAVDFSWRTVTPAPGTAQAAQDMHMAVVENGSRRPIRNVVCRIRPDPAQGYDWEAVAIGEFEEIPIAEGQLAVLQEPRASGHLPFIRAGLRFGFQFPFPANDHLEAQMKVLFTDDAGLHWQIDSDLHLERLKTRHDW